METPAAIAMMLSFAVTWLSGCGLLTLERDVNHAIAVWERDTGETDPCRLDAMQHCVGGSVAADICGPSCARLLGEWLEIRERDGDPADLANNAAGARCGLPLTPDLNDPAGAVACCADLLDANPPGLRTDGRCE